MTSQLEQTLIDAAAIHMPNPDGRLNPLAEAIRDAAIEILRKEGFEAIDSRAFGGEMTEERDSALRGTEFGFYVTISNRDLRKWMDRQ